MATIIKLTCCDDDAVYPISDINTKDVWVNADQIIFFEPVVRTKLDDRKFIAKSRVIVTSEQITFSVIETCEDINKAITGAQRY